MKRPINWNPALALLGSGAEATDGSENNRPPVSIYICNLSSVAFYVVQGCYAVYLLYRLCCANAIRSIALITAAIMLLYSSISLGILYSISNLSYDMDNWSLGDKLYYVICCELPFSLVFIAHWIILYEYLELVVVLPILCRIGEQAADARNKISSVRQCLAAAMIIVVACLVAHFVDKAFYTFKQSSKDADYSVTYFAFIFKVCLIVMTAFVFVRLRQVIKNEPLL